MALGLIQETNGLVTREPAGYAGGALGVCVLILALRGTMAFLDDFASNSAAKLGRRIKLLMPGEKLIIKDALYAPVVCEVDAAQQIVGPERG